MIQGQSSSLQVSHHCRGLENLITLTVKSKEQGINARMLVLNLLSPFLHNPGVPS